MHAISKSKRTFELKSTCLTNVPRFQAAQNFCTTLIVKKRTCRQPPLVTGQKALSSRYLDIYQITDAEYWITQKNYLKSLVWVEIQQQVKIQATIWFPNAFLTCLKRTKMNVILNFTDIKKNYIFSFVEKIIFLL